MDIVSLITLQGRSRRNALSAKRRLGRRDGQRVDEVVPLALELRMGRDADHQIEVAASSAAAAALAGYTDLLTRAHAGGNHADATL